MFINNITLPNGITIMPPEPGVTISDTWSPIIQPGETPLAGLSGGGEYTGNSLFTFPVSNGIWQSNNDGITWSKRNFDYNYSLVAHDASISNVRWIVWGNTSSNRKSISDSVVDRPIAALTQSQIISGGSVSQINSQIIYAWRGNTVYRSSDGGNNYGQAGLVPAGLRFVIDVSPGRTLALATNGYYVSSNSGGSWSSTLTPMPFTVASNSGKVKTFSGKIYAIGAGQSDVWMSADQGENWTQIYSSTIGALVDLHYNPSLNLLLVAGNTGVVYSSNDGGSWSSLPNLLTAVSGSAIRAVAASNTAVVVGTNTGLFRAQIPV